MLRTKVYMGTLERELEPFKEAASTPKFVDGSIPVYVNGWDFLFRHHSQLFALFGVNAEFVAAPVAEYKVDENGRVVPLARVGR